MSSSNESDNNSAKYGVIAMGCICGLFIAGLVDGLYNGVFPIAKGGPAAKIVDENRYWFCFVIYLKLATVSLIGFLYGLRALRRKRVFDDRIAQQPE